MKSICKFWDPHDPAFNLRIAAASLVTLGIIITLAALTFAYQVSAAGNSIDCVLSTVPAATEPIPAVTEPVQTETLPPSAEVIALQEALAAAEAERDTLRTQLSDATATADQLQEELDALRTEQETVYILLFRLERNATFPSTSVVLTFTRTVDQETYGLWEPGDIITDYDSFLTIPADGLFHDWTVVLADKYVTTETA